jgi:hypothetical protein
MAYTPPDRDTLRASVSRDLRDPANKTFQQPEVLDLINLAIVEVSRIYPKEEVQELPVDQDAQKAYLTDAQSLFRVEVMRDGSPRGVPRATSTLSTAEDGWDLHGGVLWLPYFAAAGLVAEDNPTVRIWGYWPRDLVDLDDASGTEAVDVDAEAEFAVRSVASLNGYQRLQNERGLFQQWLTNTGNQDVSPNQLAQIADMYGARWREQRNRLRTLQRT